MSDNFEQDTDISVEESDNSYLDMSDEELLALDFPEESGEVEEQEENSLEDQEQITEDDSEEEQEEESDEEEESVNDSEEEEDEEEENNDDDVEPTEEEESTDAQEQLDKLFAPFKANGKQMQVESVDEALQLMQMGVNYTKKMAGLKPVMKIAKMLENNNLLDENKLSYLIDLDKKNPEAITKLIKDSGVDPLDVNTDEAEDYQPQSYAVDDKQIEFDEVLDGLKTSPHYARTVDVVSNRWDESSKRIAVQQPQLFNVINDHMASGLYDVISDQVERERMLGKLSGISDLEAYKQVGDRLHAEGKLNPQPNQAKKIPTNAKKRNEAQVTNRKKAAAGTKAKPAGNKPKQEFDPLALSDEEFEKIASKYM